MKKMASVCAGLLFLLSTSVLAEEQAVMALQQANAAVGHGKSGHLQVLIEHAKAALEHTLAASIVAKGVLKNHLDSGANELQEAIDHGNLGHVGKATKHAEAAVVQIKAGSR